MWLAVAVNHRIAAVTTTLPGTTADARFTFLIPPSLARQGNNRVRTVRDHRPARQRRTPRHTHTEEEAVLRRTAEAELRPVLGIAFGVLAHHAAVDRIALHQPAQARGSSAL